MKPIAKENQRLSEGKGIQKSENLKVQPISVTHEIAKAAKVLRFSFFRFLPNDMKTEKSINIFST